MKSARVSGLYAPGLLVLLLLCGASTWLANAQKTPPVTPEIVVPSTVYAGEDFDVTLRVTRDSTVYSYAIGHFWVDGTEKMPPGATPDTGGFGITLSTPVWILEFTMSFPSVGVHTLRLSVDYWLDADFTITYHESTLLIPIDVQAPPPSYYVVWLQYPDEPIRAGKLIRLRFSIRDSSGSFVQSGYVRIVVEGAEIEATCGKKSGSIRINTNREYYRWYWKTESDLPEGVYSVVVYLDGAELGPAISIRIVSKT